MKSSVSEPIGYERGPRRNSLDVSPINDNSPCFHLGNGNEDISSDEHFENSKPVEVLIKKYK
jgi:hypothetical protein